MRAGFPDDVHRRTFHLRWSRAVTRRRPSNPRSEPPVVMRPLLPEPFQRLTAQRRRPTVSQESAKSPRENEKQCKTMKVNALQNACSEAVSAGFARSPIPLISSGGQEVAGSNPASPTIRRPCSEMAFTRGGHKLTDGAGGPPRGALRARQWRPSDPPLPHPGPPLVFWVGGSSPLLRQFETHLAAVDLDTPKCSATSRVGVDDPVAQARS